MQLDLPLEAIECSRFNSREIYSSASIAKMAHSLTAHGQLVPVKVRASSRDPRKYQLIYGHRRFLAAKELGWKVIRADVSELSDELTIEESLIENLERENLSDYEKALAFSRLSNEFRMTYEQIGKRLGLSKQHVSHYIGMLDLFTAESLSNNPDLQEVLHQMSEHHARILLRVEEQQMRADLAKKVQKEKLTVKELTNIVIRLRSWFANPPDERSRAEEMLLSDVQQEKSVEEMEKNGIEHLLTNKFKLAHRGQFAENLYDERFSIYSAFPPFEKLEKGVATSKVRTWCMRDAPNLMSNIEDLQVKMMGDMAIATIDMCYKGQMLGGNSELRVGGTIILTKKADGWKILHEHWSNLNAPRFSPTSEIKMRKRSMTVIRR